MMRRYKSHKEVEAGKATSWHLSRMMSNPWIDVEGEVFILDGETADRLRHLVETHGRDAFEDGYIVRYPGGYISWSPRQAFEDGYSLVEERPKRSRILRSASGPGQDGDADGAS